MSIDAILLIVMLFLPALRVGAELVSEYRALDTPSDDGGSITLLWRGTSGEDEGVRYDVWVADSVAGPFELAAQVRGDENPASELPAFGYPERGADDHYVHVEACGKDSTGAPVPLEDGHTYYFRIDRRANGQVVHGAALVSAVPRGNYFNWLKLNNLILAVAFSGIILGAIQLARRRDLYVRRIAGLEAMDEALGRATEMGRAVLFIHGLKDMSSISTIAALNILGRVARRTAEYGTMLRVTNADPVVMSVSQETVKAAYLEAGRPDAYNPDDIFIAGTDQFSYAAAIEGMMVRERPAAHIMMGYFYAESLLLAETGATTGAIQIAGTDAFTQLPFFVTTCDYTLLGEELYAASAYLSREPKLLGSLKGQDMGKAILILVILAGTLLASLGYPQLAALFSAS